MALSTSYPHSLGTFNAILTWMCTEFLQKVYLAQNMH